MEEKNKKNLLIGILLVIIVALVIVLVVVMNKKEDVKPEESNSTLTEEKVKKIEETLVEHMGGDYGLFLGEKVTIDDVNNPYLIAFNLKKYLAQSHVKTKKMDDGTEYTIFDFGEDPSVEKVDVIDGTGTSCDPDYDDKCYYRVFTVSKDEFNDFMHKTYNTNNNYNLLVTDESKTGDIIEGTMYVDSDESNYNIDAAMRGAGSNSIVLDLIKYEEEDNTLYIYDKFLTCYYEAGFGGCFKDIKDSDISEMLLDCSEGEHGVPVNEEACELENAVKSLSSKLDTYKHTFKKVDGNYYWVSSEVVK